jgi:hypothetical protein
MWLICIHWLSFTWQMGHLGDETVAKSPSLCDADCGSILIRWVNFWEGWGLRRLTLITTELLNHVPHFQLDFHLDTVRAWSYFAVSSLISYRETCLSMTNYSPHVHRYNVYITIHSTDQRSRPDSGYRIVDQRSRPDIESCAIRQYLGHTESYVYMVIRCAGRLDTVPTRFVQVQRSKAFQNNKDFNAILCPIRLLLGSHHNIYFLSAKDDIRNLEVLSTS